MKRKCWGTILRNCLASALVLTGLTGCVTTQVTVTPGVELTKYRRVYLLPSNGDPRNVTPRVLARLKQTGFEVSEVNSNNPTIADQGSGFVISPEGHILTCSHVLENQTNATVWISSLRYPCRVLANDTNADLALLQVNVAHEPFRPLPFSPTTNYFMGQSVFTMGFPLAGVLGTEPRLNNGMVSATVGLDDDPKFVQVSAAVQPGNSGGPLLTPEGQAMGVVSATLNPLKVFAQSGGALPQNVNFAIKLNIVRDFLASNHIKLPETPTNNAAQAFEEAKKSLALVRPGNVTDEELKQPVLICVFGYYSFFDVWWRFKRIQIEFVDLKKGDLVFRVGQYRDDPFSSENAELDQLFSEISSKFFPDRPNPFKGKK
ncbi:MAG TPA: serine protease [Verrucomicrobiae bacterium]|nr:serine protease [Verrucomicrobiae bacterium]